MEHVAIDLGSRESQICVRSADATILEEHRWRTPDLEKYLSKRPQSRVIIETSSEAFAVAEMAKRCMHEIRVIPSTLVKTLGIGARGVKNDRSDAQAMSKASCQIDLPSIHVPSRSARELRSTLTSREALVESRTKLINTVRGWMRTEIISVKNGAPTTFPSRVRTRLLETPMGIPMHIEQLVVAIEALNAQIEMADAELAKLAKASEVAQRLMTMPGVGHVTSLRFIAAIDDVKRFKNAHELESYLGLTPGEKITGFKGHRTHLTKAGPSKVRWTLVQAAWVAIRYRPNDPMVRWAMQVASRRGRLLAAVALARKMAGILFAMWRDQTSYNPMRGATKTLITTTRRDSAPIVETPSE